MQQPHASAEIPCINVKNLVLLQLADVSMAVASAAPSAAAAAVAGTSILAAAAADKLYSHGKMTLELAIRERMKINDCTNGKAYLYCSSFSLH